MRDLLDILWRERDALGALADEYEAHRAGEGAQERLRSVQRALVTAELVRAIRSRALGAEFGLDRDPSLAELIEVCPSNASAILSAHRDALRAATDRVVAVTAGGGSAEPGSRLPVQRSLLDFLS